MIKIKNIPEAAIKIPLPDVFQETNYSCGAAALASLFNYYSKGPIDERQIGQLMGMTKSGTDPYQIVSAVKKVKLRYKEYRNMNITKLKRSIYLKRPVMIMLQAWGNKQKYESCGNNCKDGHWLIAIGYDKENFYFEDPSLYRTVGYIRINELDSRWHDVESYSSKDTKVHFTDHYGIAIWGNRIAYKQFRAREVM